MEKLYTVSKDKTWSRLWLGSSAPYYKIQAHIEKSRKSRDTWSNRQIWSWGTKRSGTKANRVLPKECNGHSKQPLPTTQEKTLRMDITRWSTPKSD